MSCFLSDRWFPQLLPSPASSPKAPLSPSYCGEAQNPGTCGAVSVWHRAAWVGFLWKYRAADNLFHSKLTFSISCLWRAIYRYTVHWQLDGQSCIFSSRILVFPWDAHTLFFHNVKILINERLSFTQWHWLSVTNERDLKKLNNKTVST